MFYEFSNKSGRMLARAVQHKKATHTIDKIKDASGNSFVSPDDIAAQFVKYFSKLYNLTPIDMTEHAQARREMIATFLQQYCTTTLSPADSTTLEGPINGEETAIALKQLKTGKSPGPDGLTVSYYKTVQEAIIPHFIKSFNSLRLSPQATKDCI